MNLKEILASTQTARKESYDIIRAAVKQLDEVINTAIEVIAEKKGTIPAHTRRALIVEIPLRLYSVSNLYETLGLMESTTVQKIEVQTAECMTRAYEAKKSIADKEALAKIECADLNDQLNMIRHLRYILSDKIKYCYELLLSLKKLEDTLSTVDTVEDKPRIPSLQYKGRE